MEEKREATDATVGAMSDAAEAPEGQGSDSGPAECASSPRKKGSSKKARRLRSVVLALRLTAAAALGYQTLGAGGQAATDQTSGSALSSSSATDSEDESDPFGASSGSSASSSGFGALSDRNSTVYDVDGNAVQVADLPKGRVCVINYWATWCPQCVDEFLDLARIYQAYGDRVSFAFLDSTDGQRETTGKVRDFLDKGGYDVPVYYDSHMNFGTDYQSNTCPRRSSSMPMALSSPRAWAASILLRSRAGSTSSSGDNGRRG